jgi:hypothetical protein
MFGPPRMVDATKSMQMVERETRARGAMSCESVWRDLILCVYVGVF